MVTTGRGRLPSSNTTTTASATTYSTLAPYYSQSARLQQQQQQQQQHQFEPIRPGSSTPLGSTSRGASSFLDGFSTPRHIKQAQPSQLTLQQQQQMKQKQFIQRQKLAQLQHQQQLKAQVLQQHQQQQQRIYSNFNYYYQPQLYGATPSSIGTSEDDPISRSVSQMSNKSSSDHFYTYPYYPSNSRKVSGEDASTKVPPQVDWNKLLNRVRRVVLSREEEIEAKCDCSHETHDIRGLKRHQHVHENWPNVPPSECNVNFLLKISDDERMSLTTAVSDEDGDGGGGANSPLNTKGSRRKPAASFNCTGAVRKAGFLSVKKWLLRKRHQVELAKRRGWKGYWVCLKGTTLLFYPCDARETRSVEASPKHLIIVDGAIMQPVPEHPKRDYIFCLSTAFGDAYLFQAPCQVELDSWIHSIHWACAAAFARHRGKTGTLHLLQEDIIRLDKAIESDGKLRHMAELQRSVVADPETRQQLAQQIAGWEENIERLHCEQFRLRCYMASLQGYNPHGGGGELPNPKSLLSHVSRTTKNTLNTLGVFTVSSFHAFVCARSPSLLSNLLAGRGATKRRAPLLSRSNSASSRRSLHISGDESQPKGDERSAKISLPDNQVVTVPLKESMTVEEFLVNACAKNLSPLEHFIRVKKRRELPDTNYFVPHRSDLIENYLSTHEVVEVRAKLLYQVELCRSSGEQMWGFSVEAELVENSDRQDELCCYVSRVEERSVAMNNGISKMDDILVINGAIVSDLDMMYIESVLQEELSLCLMLRSSRTEPPHLAAALAAADAAIARLVCPPPPAMVGSDPMVLTDDLLSHLIVPAPSESKDLSPSDGPDDEMFRGPSLDVGILENDSGREVGSEINNLIKDQNEGGNGGSPLIGSPGTTSPPSHPHSHTRDTEKMKKVVLELIETERSYVKHLTILLEQYLEPLRHENFLSAKEMMAIFGNIREMVGVQRKFLKSLEMAIEAEEDRPSLESIQQPSDFKLILKKIALAFHNFADHFKLYSSFCASHSKAQKLLHPTEGNQALQQFLASRNPRQQHSNTLESYLIKPIQRILKYPLLLQQLRNLCDTNSEEYRNLVDSLHLMERVAEHINEMQRIHEEYGAIFEHLFRQYQKHSKLSIDLSPGDLLHYGGVEWVNIADFLGKIKKGLELHAMCFVFRSAVVFLCKERLRHKKKLMGSTSRSSSDKSEVEIIRYQVLIPVQEVQVRQICDPNKPEEEEEDEEEEDLREGSSGGSSNYSWELIHLRNQTQRRSEKIYLLSNSTQEFRNAFMRNIRQIIRESVRNMSLPARIDSHYATPEGCEVTDSNSFVTKHRTYQAQTLGRKKPPKPPQRHSAGNLETGSSKILRSQESSDSDSRFRVRSKTMSDKSDSEEGGGAASSSQQPSGQPRSGTSSTIPRMKILGSTPNHLTLSTTSTLSGIQMSGSTGSAAKLIQASSTPASYHSAPPPPEPTSPIWKPREGDSAFNTLPSTSKKGENQLQIPGHSQEQTPAPAAEKSSSAVASTSKDSKSSEKNKKK